MRPGKQLVEILELNHLMSWKLAYLNVTVLLEYMLLCITIRHITLGNLRCTQLVQRGQLIDNRFWQHLTGLLVNVQSLSCACAWSYFKLSGVSHGPTKWWDFPSDSIGFSRQRAEQSSDWRMTISTRCRPAQMSRDNASTPLCARAVLSCSSSGITYSVHGGEFCRWNSVSRSCAVPIENYSTWVVVTPSGPTFGRYGRSPIKGGDRDADVMRFLRLMM